MGPRRPLEGKRAGEDAPADHDAVDPGVFRRQAAPVLVVFDVAVDLQQGVRGDLVPQLHDVVDQLVMRGDPAHFLLGPQVDRQQGNVLFQ